jgi:hypothetical protein
VSLGRGEDVGHAGQFAIGRDSLIKGVQVKAVPVYAVEQ